MLETIVHFLLHLVETIGYAGIFLMAMIESTFIPIASELTMVPAGYLVYQGKLDALPVFASSLLGSMSGSLINYSIAYYFGRPLLMRHRKFFMMGDGKFEKVENFFAKHGPFAVLIGRMTYGVRHYISFPAGLAKMDLKKFCLSTGCGDAVWVSLLLGLGYALGGNEARLAAAMPFIKMAVVAVVVTAIFLYVKKQKKEKIKSSS